MKEWKTAMIGLFLLAGEVEPSSVWDQNNERGDEPLDLGLAQNSEPETMPDLGAASAPEVSDMDPENEMLAMNEAHSSGPPM